MNRKSKPALTLDQRITKAEEQYAAAAAKRVDLDTQRTIAASVEQATYTLVQTLKRMREANKDLEIFLASPAGALIKE